MVEHEETHSDPGPAGSTGAAAASPGLASPNDRSLGSRALRGSLWSTAGFGTAQVIRLGCNLILTRLLFPEAFGLMALLNALLAGLAMFSDLGLAPSIVQSPRGDDPRFLNTAWTLQIGRGLVLWILACLLSWPVAVLYDQPAILALLPVAAITVLVAGFNSTSLPRLQRHLAVARLTLLELAGQISAALVMIVWALIQPTVWALVAGGLTSSVVRLLLSHTVVADRRDKLGWERDAARALFEFGKWIFVSTLLAFLVGQADRLVFGKLVPLGTLGVYSIAAMLALMPIHVVNRIGSAVVFPAFSRKMAAAADIGPIYRRARRPILALGGLIVACLVACGPPLIETLYDPRYHDAGWILQLLAIAAWFQILEVPSGSALLALGLPRWLATANALKLAGILVLLPVRLLALRFPGRHRRLRPGRDVPLRDLRSRGAPAGASSAARRPLRVRAGRTGSSVRSLRGLRDRGGRRTQLESPRGLGTGRIPGLAPGFLRPSASRGRGVRPVCAGDAAAERRLARPRGGAVLQERVTSRRQRESRLSMDASGSPCRICGASLRHTFVDLGASPLCESFLAADECNRMEPFYPLHAYVCERCFLVQLEEYVAPEEIFSEYAYFSSYSDSWLRHARDYVEAMVARFALGRESHVVELASNDGYLLQYFVEKGIPVLGIEPAANVAEAAKRRGVPTEVRFFDAECAREMAGAGRRADLLVGNNVLAQVPDLRGFVRGMKLLLKPEGVITLEFPHLLRLMLENQFDTIYHEHFSYFSLTAIEPFLRDEGLSIFDVEELTTHGGSLRIFARHSEDDSRAGHGARGASPPRGEGSGARPDRDLLRLFRAGEGDQAPPARLPDPGEARGKQDRGLRRPGQGEYPAQLLRDPHRFHRFHGGPESLQAGAFHARHADSDPAAREAPRSETGLRPDPPLEPQGRDHRAGIRDPRVGWPIPGSHSRSEGIFVGRRGEITRKRLCADAIPLRSVSIGEIFMKVVLFCGGLGMRLREFSEEIPKPMVPIGYRPILWHLMKYYAHFGHKDFVLCLGYRADAIKNYFLNYDECLSNDFVLSEGGQRVEVLARDISDWKITFADTGMNTNIAGRMMAVREHLAGEDYFLANYADGLCDIPLNAYIDDFVGRDRIASFVAVRPTTAFHIASLTEDGTVERVVDLANSGIQMNGGFFVFRSDIFDYIKPGEELINEPFARLIAQQQLVAHSYDGFWMSMDTFKDKQLLDDVYSRGRAPWEVWKAEPAERRSGGERRDR